eukprot:7388236-Prymnesium_polylepis.1
MGGSRGRPLATSEGGCAYELQGQQAKRSFTGSSSRRWVMERVPSGRVPPALRALFNSHNALDQELFDFARAQRT